MPEKNVLIDYRFSSPGEYDLNGYAINSIAEMAPQLNHIKSVGFNTITLALEIPIDLSTGRVNFGKPGGSDLSMIADTWKVVDYAHSIGLSVKIQILPCGAFNADGSRNGADPNLTSTVSLGAGVTFDKIFNNTIIPYDLAIAKIAQQHNIEGIYVGSNMYGLDTTSYLGLWQNLIDSVHSVYTGQIAYQAMWDNAVWSLTNSANYFIDPLISTVPMYNLSQIVEGYYHTLDDGNVIETIQNLIQKYGNSLILDGFHVQTANPGIGNNIVIPDLLYSGNLSGLTSLPAPNYCEQALALRAYVYVAQHLLGDGNTGVGIDGYMPWEQTSWIQKPNNTFAEYWHQSSILGWNLWGNTSAESALRQAFTQDPLPNYYFSTPHNDVFVGKNGVINTAVFYGPSSTATITKNTDGITVSSTFNGSDTLTNIQRLEFSDTVVAFDSSAGQPTGEVYRLYTAALGRAPDTAGLGYWINALDHGVSLHNVAGGFIESIEFHNNFYGDGSTSTFVTALYHNVLHRAPEKDGFDFWVNSVNHGVSRADVLIGFSESPENVAQTVGLVGQGIHYDQYVG